MAKEKATRIKRRKPASERVEEPVKALVTADGRVALEAAASRDQRTLSAWARRALVRAARGGDAA